MRQGNSTVGDECKHCILWIENMTTGTSESIRVLSNGWAIDTTAPVDLKNSKDNEVSRINVDVNGPLRVVCFKIRTSLVTLSSVQVLSFMFSGNSPATLSLMTPYIFNSRYISDKATFVLWASKTTVSCYRVTLAR